jgi:hypothetical protein
MCAIDSRSFMTCEGRGLLALIDVILQEAAKSKSKLSAGDLMPDRTTISRYVTTEAAGLRKELAPGIKESIGLRGGSMTTDMWTEDYNKTSYMSLTYHSVQNMQVHNSIYFKQLKMRLENVVCNFNLIRDTSFKHLVDQINIKPNVINSD